MLEKPVISIIVPMYNSETTIRRCLDSLLKQTIKETEIVVIDDASTDRSVNIVKKYQKKYRNIKLILNHKNLGAGATKNIGLQHTQAECIGFCDADDYIKEDYYEKLYRALLDFNADISCCDIALVHLNHTEYMKIFDNNLYEIVHRKNSESMKERVVTAEEMTAHGLSASAASKLFRKSIVEEFFDGACDDLLFTYSALKKASRIVYVPENYYFYVQRDNSLEHKEIEKKRLTLGDCLTQLTEKLKSYQNGKEFLKIIYGLSGWGIVRDIAEDKLHRQEFIKIYYEKLKFREYLNNNDYFKAGLLFKPVGEQRFILMLIQYFCERKYEELFQLYDRYATCPEKYLPKVSIVIPVYNGSNYLEEAISSALNQKYPNFEVIVVNDGSNDDGKTEAIAKNFGDKIRYFRKENGGVASALNYGIKQMEGEYFSWLSHDDLYKENKILSQIEALQHYIDKTTVVVSGYDVVDKFKNKLYEVSPLKQYSKEQLETPLFAVLHGCINGCAVLIHKAHFERVGVFDITLPTTQDYDLWFRMLRGQKICYLSENGVLSRAHEAQDSRRLYDKHLMECAQLWIGMMEQLHSKEMEEIGGTEYNFYISEKKFFDETPYKKVSYWIDRKIIRLLQEEWKQGKKDAVNKLSGLLNISSDILKSTILNDLSQIEQYKIAVVTSEKLEKLSEIVSKSCKNTCLQFIVREDCGFKKIAGKEKNFLYPKQLQKTLPLLLKFIGCETVIFVDSQNLLLKEMYGCSSGLDMRVLRWTGEKYWVINDSLTLSEKAEEILALREIDIPIWSDEESAAIAGIEFAESVYIPFIEDVDKLVKKWEKLLSGENFETCSAEMIDYKELSKNIMRRCQNGILKDSAQIVQVAPKVIYVENTEEQLWKERYDAIYESSFWKMTKPLRLISDKLKMICQKRK